MNQEFLTQQLDTENKAKSNEDIVESNILIFDDVFSNTELDALLCLVGRWENRFSETKTGDENTQVLDKKKRDSLVLFDFEPIYSFFRVQLYKYAPTIHEKLGYKMELHKGFECQLTAHNDGHFYCAHTDYVSETNTRVSKRALTFVYYFYNEPKQFDGGELFIWDHYKTKSDPLTMAGQGKYIEPKNNRIVFFDSKYWHEVKQVNCKSQEFRDSRFTLNGWLHK